MSKSRFSRVYEGSELAVDCVPVPAGTRSVGGVRWGVSGAGGPLWAGFLVGPPGHVLGPFGEGEVAASETAGGCLPVRGVEVEDCRGAGRVAGLGGDPVPTGPVCCEVRS